LRQGARGGEEVMTLADIKKFEDFLQEAFTEGEYAGELRLSSEEKEYVERKCPKILLRKMVTEQCPDGKQWFEIICKK
jgi:hypothetical protein